MTPWTDERIAVLRELHAQGLTFSGIAAQLGGGLTRNAVIGKAMRIGLDKRGNDHNPINRAERQRKRQERKAYHRPVGPKPVEYTGNPVALLDLLNHHCRWPVSGEGAAMLFCSATKIDGHSWCDQHCRMAYSGATRQMSRAEIEVRTRMLKRRAA